MRHRFCDNTISELRDAGANDRRDRTPASCTLSHPVAALAHAGEQSEHAVGVQLPAGTSVAEVGEVPVAGLVSVRATDGQCYRVFVADLREACNQTAAVSGES